MKNSLFEKAGRSRLAWALAAISLLTIAVVRADLPWVLCSHGVNMSVNTCTTTDGCKGTVYDYENNGTLICTLTNYSCSAAGTSSLYDCQPYIYAVISYPYDNLTFLCGLGTSPCIPNYNICPVTIYPTNFTVRSDSNCAGQ